MADVMEMGPSLLSMARSRLGQHSFPEAERLLRQLLRLPALSPQVLAEATLLQARLQTEVAQVSEARRYLHRRFAAPGNESGPAPSLEHPIRLRALSSSRPGLRSRREQVRRQLRMLADAYREHPDDPEVVHDYFDGLMTAGAIDDAELLLVHAAGANRSDRRFRQLSSRLGDRIRRARLFGGRRRTQPRATLPFRCFGGPSDPAPPAGHKKDFGHGGEGDAPLLEPTMSLLEILTEIPREQMSAIYQSLGLFGRRSAPVMRREIAAALSQSGFLRRLMRELPTASRQLLRSLVRAGGYLPVGVLFQNCGPDAPPADHVQPLLRNGLLYFGRAPGRAEKFMAVVPADLLSRLAALWKLG